MDGAQLGQTLGRDDPRRARVRSDSSATRLRQLRQHIDGDTVDLLGPEKAGRHQVVVQFIRIARLWPLFFPDPIYGVGVQRAEICAWCRIRGPA